MRQTRTTTVVPMSTHRFCRRNISLGEEAELPEICVLVGEMQLMTLAGGEYDLNNEPLRINSANQNKF